VSGYFYFGFGLVVSGFDIRSCIMQHSTCFFEILWHAHT